MFESKYTESSFVLCLYCVVLFVCVLLVFVFVWGLCVCVCVMCMWNVCGICGVYGCMVCMWVCYVVCVCVCVCSCSHMFVKSREQLQVSLLRYHLYCLLFLCFHLA